MHGIDLSSLSPLPPFSLPKNFEAVAFAGISRRLNVKEEEPCGNCVCTWKSTSFSQLRATAADFISWRRRAMSLFSCSGSKASDKLPRINDESGCRLLVIKNTPSARKVKFFGTSFPRNFNLDLLWGRAGEIESASSTFPLTAWYIYLKRQYLEFFRDMLWTSM